MRNAHFWFTSRQTRHYGSRHFHAITVCGSTKLPAFICVPLFCGACYLPAARHAPLQRLTFHYCGTVSPSTRVPTDFSACCQFGIRCARCIEHYTISCWNASRDGVAFVPTAMYRGTPHTVTCNVAVHWRTRHAVLRMAAVNRA